MSPAMSNLVLVLSILIVDICHCQTTDISTCDQLPKLKLESIEVLVANGPFKSDFTLIPLHKCSTKVFTHPERGTDDYHGTLLNIQGSELNTYDLDYDSDTKTVGVKNCGTGEVFRGHVLASQFDKNGGFFCTYRCNNTILSAFACSSNNNGASPAELDAVKLASKVPNGDQIDDARKDCNPSKTCKVF